MKKLFIISLICLAQNTLSQEVIFRDAKDSTQNFYQQFLPSAKPKV